MIEVKKLNTGLRRGYVRVAERGIPERVDIKAALFQHKRSNEYKLVKALVDYGCKDVFVERHQDSRSSQYMYYTYIGHKFYREAKNG